MLQFSWLFFRYAQNIFEHLALTYILDIGNSLERNIHGRILGRYLIPPHQCCLSTSHCLYLWPVWKTTSASRFSHFIHGGKHYVRRSKRLYSSPGRKMCSGDRRRRHCDTEPSRLLRYCSSETTSQILFNCARYMGNR
jgi:hypothetical protein